MKTHLDDPAPPGLYDAILASRNAKGDDILQHVSTSSWNAKGSFRWLRELRRQGLTLWRRRDGNVALCETGDGVPHPITAFFRDVSELLLVHAAEQAGVPDCEIGKGDPQALLEEMPGLHWPNRIHPKGAVARIYEILSDDMVTVQVPFNEGCFDYLEVRRDQLGPRLSRPDVGTEGAA